MEEEEEEVVANGSFKNRMRSKFLINDECLVLYQQIVVIDDSIQKIYRTFNTLSLTPLIIFPFQLSFCITNMHTQSKITKARKEDEKK